MTQHTFQARLEKAGGLGSWTMINIPFDVATVYGVKGRFAVKGTVNGVQFRSSLMPLGNGVHYMVVNSTLRKAAGVDTGDLVDVVMEPDAEPREVDVPEDLQVALAANPVANQAFARMSYSHQKEYVNWIEAAVKRETRMRRITKAVDRLQQEF